LNDAPFFRAHTDRCADNPDCRPDAYLINSRMAAPNPTNHPNRRLRTARRDINPLPEPPPVTEAMARAHARYWRFNIVLIVVLMTIGLFVSFGVPMIARGLEHVRFAGFSLPFYMGAQGAILAYLLLIAVYIVLMQRADAALQRALEDSAAER
jgi:putative solute:sodium symporter small subunit